VFLDIPCLGFSLSVEIWSGRGGDVALLGNKVESSNFKNKTFFEETHSQHIHNHNLMEKRRLHYIFFVYY